ncbi:oxidoreductase [Fructilactobacillus myrtifloralis]|uniref:Oxidoreductase n=2 Tax=Fructilactobacillus myrtifloralis TaxID=2940301 RepID=A0ABY5BRX3_9LACO|nr:oxidoreductase [Fructilactobacillus myrtifloralis]USS85792.1 oxidoreductase [Fructilactobacillus myrtifloralis]
MKTVLVTGASSGMGYQIAQRLAQTGYQVFGAARHVERMEPLAAVGVIPLQLDVTKEESRTAVVHQLMERGQRIDAVVNAAGYGSFGAQETVSDAEAKRQFEVNVFGLMALNRLILPYMRTQHAGRIINISSIAGRFSSPLAGWYFASKHALETLSDSLRMEVRSFGIQVILIEPGVVKSRWEAIAMHHLDEAVAGTVYEDQAHAFQQNMDRTYASQHASEPAIIAQTVQKALESKHPRPRYVVGYLAKPIVWLTHWLPTWLQDWLIPQLM